MGQHRFYYGWIIVAVSCINLAVIFGLWYSFSVFFVAIIEEFHWSRAATSGVFSCFIIVHSFSAILVGSALDRFGPRRVIPAAVCLVAAGLVASSRIQELWQLYFWYGMVTAAGVCAIGFIAHSMILPRWFERKRGLAIGIAMAGIGIGMQIIVPTAQYLIELYGWRSAYLIMAVMILVTLLPLNLLLQRSGPEEIGEVPDGWGSRSIDDVTAAAEPESEERANRDTEAGRHPNALTLRDALRTRSFWFLASSFFFTPLAIQGTLIHQVASVTDKGFAPVQAAFFFGMAGIFGSAGKIIFGSLSDRIGREPAFALGMSCAATGVLSLFFLQEGRNFLLYTYAVLFGLGYGSVAPVMPARAADLFLGPHFGKIFGMIAIAGGTGGAFGVLLSGKIFDITNNYTIAFLVAIVAIILSIALFIRASSAGPGKSPGQTGR